MMREHCFKFKKSDQKKNQQSNIKYMTKGFDHQIKANQSIEEVIQNIDNQINQAFDNNKKVLSLHIQNLKSIRQNHRQAFTLVKHDTPIIRENKNLMKKENGISLINNKDVMKYVRHIYSYYNIQDPQLRSKENQTRKKINFGSTNKKLGNYIREETIDTTRTINSARTSESNEAQKDNICVNPFLYHQNHQEKTERTHRKLIILKTKTKSPKSRINSFSNTQFPVATQKLEKNDLNKTTNINMALAKERIDVTYRYCFMCQQPILENNLKFHQEQCFQLKKAYHYTLEQLMNILDEKILKLMEEVRDNYITKSNQQILNDHLKSKQIIEKWLNEVNDSFQDYSLEGMFSSKGRENSYKNNIEETILKKNAIKLQAINKLHWFLKLNRNIKSKYYNQL